MLDNSSSLLVGLMLVSEPIDKYKPAPLSRQRPLCEAYPVLEKVPLEQAVRETPGAMLADQLYIFGMAVVGCGVTACRYYCYVELVEHGGEKLVNITSYSQSLQCLGSAIPPRQHNAR
jgi:hypothetical protein